MYASPFDEELIQKDAFNAVLYKEVIQNKSEIVYQHRKFRLLYNPTLNHISETNHQYGSFYYPRTATKFFSLLLSYDALGSDTQGSLNKEQNLFFVRYARG